MMHTVRDKEIIAYLARHYSSALAKRALWLWSGGPEADIDYDLPPEDGWGLMWAKAEALAVPTRVGLVREMLWDAPGEEFLLGCLGELAAERFKPEKDAADFFLFLLEKTGGAERRLPALLYLFQDMAPDGILAATAPAIQTVRDAEPCEKLEANISRFESRRISMPVKVLVAWMEFYFDCLAEDAANAVDIMESVGQSKKLLAGLKSLVVAEATPAGNGGDEAADKPAEHQAAFEKTLLQVHDQIAVLKAMAPEAAPRFFASTVAVIVALLGLLETSGPGTEKIALQLTAIEPLKAALWATRIT